MRSMLPFIVLGALVASAPVQAQYWNEDFESYPTGQLASGAGGWMGWDNVPSVMGDIVTTQASSGTQSLEIGFPDDTIQPFSLNDPTGYPQSGFWRLTAMWYIPSASWVGGFGSQYILIQSQYNHLGPKIWALQFLANPLSGFVEDDDRPEVNAVPVVTDQWVPVRIDMDLDNDGIATYYNGTLVSTGTFATAIGDPTSIACINLWCEGSSTTTSYWDDFDVSQATPEYQINQPASSLDFNGLSNNYLNPIKAELLANTPATLNIGCQPGSVGWDIALTMGPTVSLSNGGFGTLGGQVINLDLTDPTFDSVGFVGPCAAIAVPVVMPPIQFSAQQVVYDPTLPDNLALSAALEVSVLSCANPQNFDTTPTGIGSYALGWSNGGGSAEWATHSGGTTSTATGPTAASSLPNYIYCETSGLGGTSNFKVNTCTFDTASIPAPMLSFDLSRIGVSTGTLVVRQDDGSGSFPIVSGSFVGPDPAQSQGGIEWTAQTLPVDTTTPGAIPRFQFDYTAGGTFTGDLGIDNVMVQ